MNKTLINILITILIALIFIFILMFIGNSVGQKFEIDEGYIFLEMKNLPSKEMKIEMNKIKERETQLNVYEILNFIGICLSIISIRYLNKKKKKLL